MAKQWKDDQALVDAISQNLYDALPLLPKRLVRVDALAGIAVAVCRLSPRRRGL
jgi:hypothetical protein